MKSIALIALGVAVAAGCASTSADHTQREPHGMMHETMCPMKVPGTRVVANDVEGGVAMSFTTHTGDVGELRRRVHHMAAMHEARMCEGMMVAASATVTDIDGGARIVLVPEDPARLADLRQHARAHVNMMAGGRCPMMATR